jgi:predicted HTH transcriptional regulator
MDLSDLKRYVSLGEGLHVEFKRRFPRPERIAKEAIAFANAAGGHLFLGVGDDGTIVGLRDVVEEEYAVLKALTRRISPPIEATLSRVPINGRKEVLVLDIPESRTKPHFLVEDGADINGTPPEHARRVAYVRIGASSVEASKEAVRLMRYEAEPHDVRFEFGEKERKLMRYLDRHERITVETFARIADIPRRRASQTLVLLAKANVLRLHIDERDDYFTMAYGNKG